MESLSVLRQQRTSDLKHAVLSLNENNSGDLRPELRGVILRTQERLEALDALGRVEELLMCLDDLVDPLATETELLRDEDGAVG